MIDVSIAWPQALTVNQPETLRPAGWGDKPGVRIVFGRWQDVLPELRQYDGIFFDTYGEYYEDLRWDKIESIDFKTISSCRKHM